jgi:polyphenol oxidase
MSDMVQCPALGRLPSVRHGFFTRRLNRPGGDGDAARLLGLPPAQLVTVKQVHGAQVLRVEGPLNAAAKPSADGMATATPGLGLGIVTADCAPVLFADAAGGVIGACHAGWRGALADIIEATVTAMEELGAKRQRIAAAIGPTIAQKSYEVGPEFAAAFLADDAANARFFAPSPRAGHSLFDLPGYIGARLARLGLGEIADLKRDTAGEPGMFHSYRRATLAKTDTAGRQLSAIALIP